jgi:hypothetical protein
MEKLEILHPGFLARGTENLAISTAEKDHLASQIQIPDGSFFPSMQNRSGAAAEMTDRAELFSRPHMDKYPILVQELLPHQFYSTKGKVWCYTERGHRQPPFGLWTSDTHKLQEVLSYVPFLLTSSSTH